MRILSLFDWMSCWQLASKRAWINVTKYYASEIDKYAIQITQKNFPKTIQLWDIKNLTLSNLPKDIDIVIWWSPCQGFSFAWKQLNFKDERSKLFFEFVRVLKLAKPKYFLFENVKMKEEYQDVISKYLWVQPIQINSSLVSAQNRVRLYWANIPNIKQPQDKNIMLSDILEDDTKLNDDVYFKNSTRSLAFKNFEMLTKSKIAPTWLHQIAQVNLSNYKSSNRVYSPSWKAPTLTTKCWDLYWPKILVVPENTLKGYIEVNYWECFDATFLNSKTRRWRAMKQKSNCLTASNYDFMQYTKKWLVRKFTPIECERLQTLPDNYTFGVSKTQRYNTILN